MKIPICVQHDNEYYRYQINTDAKLSDVNLLIKSKNSTLDTKTLFFLSDTGDCFKTSTQLSEIYYKYKNDKNILLLKCFSENIFG